MLAKGPTKDMGQFGTPTYNTAKEKTNEEVAGTQNETVLVTLTVVGVGRHQ